ncbi:MAG: hypothetical protein BWY09_00690 [Candidatus Hydrogenedentes bacterium ADurb.Bin179]|nr:MAG: hypothetical protein BWY09_00690 [Candidatus Hydrogenedentes bacterium ADurb.Bin179]
MGSYGKMPCLRNGYQNHRIRGYADVRQDNHIYSDLNRSLFALHVRCNNSGAIGNRRDTPGGVYTGNAHGTGGEYRP